MSQIINNVSLITGSITSTAVVAPNNVRFHIAISNVVDATKEITVTLKVKDGSANYVKLADEKDYPIEFKFKGNTEKSRNIFSINSASLIAVVTNPVGLVGNISIWTNES